MCYLDLCADPSHARGSIYEKTKVHLSFSSGFTGQNSTDGKAEGKHYSVIIIIIIIINRHSKRSINRLTVTKARVVTTPCRTVWNKAVFSNCLKSLRGKSRLRRWASIGLSFQAVGPEEPKERSPKLAAQDRGTSSLYASAERNRGRPGTEVSNVQKRDR